MSRVGTVLGHNDFLTYSVLQNPYTAEVFLTPTLSKIHPDLIKYYLNHISRMMSMLDHPSGYLGRLWTLQHV